MTKATAFQIETVKVACAALRDPSGARRFLVADEAGLGKTIVAQRIIEDFKNKIDGDPGRGGRKFNIIYVCSNLAIARQNRDRLLGFLRKDEQKAATVEEDRLSMTVLPQKNGRGAKAAAQVSLRLYSVTPGTSMLNSSVRRRNTGGTTKERALCFVLLRKALGGEVDGIRDGLALRVEKSNFMADVRIMERENGPFSKTIVENFKQALRRSLGLDEKQMLAPAIKRFLPDDAKHLVQHMRLALANVAIANIDPDLVIFDEFQRFEDLIRPEPDEVDQEGDDDPEDEDAGFREEAGRLLQSLRGGGQHRALLLLSATPWIPYRSRAEENPKARNANDGFLEVVKFLYGSSRRSEIDTIKMKLLERRQLLTAGCSDWPEVDRNHDELLSLLTPVMARTERRRELSADALKKDASILKASLQLEDLAQFKSFHECVMKGNKQDAPNSRAVKLAHDLEMLVPLWNSVPVPMQSLGPRYLVWDRARKLASAAGIDPNRVNQMAPGKFPHPRLRALIDHLQPERLALPWIAPSHEWWPLANGWERKYPNFATTPNGAVPVDGKLLIFARFRAVVPVVAGLVSYHVETAARGRARVRSREGAYKREGLSAFIRPEATTSFELFHPCPFLIKADPIADRLKAGSVAEALSRVEHALATELTANGVQIVAGGETSRPAFDLIVGIEAHLGLWDATKEAWRDTGFAKKLPDRPEPIACVSGLELKELAHLALSGPGVVLGRAIQRHTTIALKNNFDRIVDASWSGLRTRFDEPWIARTLKGTEESFPVAIRRAVIEGNLEATLDEHFWFMKQTAPNSAGEIIGELIDEFRDAISLNRSSIGLHHGKERNNRPSLQLRCHVATPFTRPDHADKESVRPDDVRKAFNSPFWPHVLVTTSIGQEGLDFHPWCQTLLHWDPPPGPVALEQREGRVDRYASLAIRRAIARDMGADSSQPHLRASPWDTIAKRAVDGVTDHKGLQPWWIYRNARPLHMRFELDNSEICERWEQAHEERGHYRLVLGMPNQNDLLGDLRSIKELSPESLARACLDFSPINRPNRIREAACPRSERCDSLKADVGS
jgi:hypothetical protein